jgi:hypothetical protein
MGCLGRNMDGGTLEQSLRRLIDAIVVNDDVLFSSVLDWSSSALAGASFSEGATRQGPNAGPYFIKEIGHYIYSGDTALHLAAASYRHNMADKLIKVGANLRARNRRGAEPLHAAAFGIPGSSSWDPDAQTATIVGLIKAGADPNAQNMDGATPLHRAVRTRGTGPSRARSRSDDPQQEWFDGHATRLAYHGPRRVRLTRGQGSATRDSAATTAMKNGLQ